MGRALADVAPRGAVAGIESAVRELGARIEMTRDARFARRGGARRNRFLRRDRGLGPAGSGDKPGADNVAPRSGFAALKSSLRALGENWSGRATMVCAEPCLRRSIAGSRLARRIGPQALAEVLPEVMPGVMAEFMANSDFFASADFDVVASPVARDRGQARRLVAGRLGRPRRFPQGPGDGRIGRDRPPPLEHFAATRR